jgi:hypothetical protein
MHYYLRHVIFAQRVTVVHSRHLYSFAFSVISAKAKTDASSVVSFPPVL